MAHLYGLIDAARDRRLHDLITAEPEHACLFAGKLEPALERAAPFIVRLPESSRFLRIWRDEGRGRSWGIQCVSAKPLADLRRHFRHFLQAKLPDGEIVLFRFYDPRVWRVYIPTCALGDLSRWFNDVDEYISETEDGSGVLRYSLRGGALAVN